MRQEIEAQAPLRRTDASDGSGMDRLHTVLAGLAAAILLAAIAFILGATVLT